MISFLLLVVACSSLKSAFTNASSSLSMNSETGVEVQTSVESEQTCLKLPPNKEHNVILDSNQANIQKVNPQDNTHVFM
jgi:uncharacterized protein YcfL